MYVIQVDSQFSAVEFNDRRAIDEITAVEHITIYTYVYSGVFVRYYEIGAT